MLLLRAQLVSCFPTNEFKDKETGTVTPAGHKVQLQYKEPVKVNEAPMVDGKPVMFEKIVLREFNVHKNGALWAPSIGKIVQIQVLPYVDEAGKVAFYLSKDAKPSFVG